jgi:hypothetical protein
VDFEELLYESQFIQSIYHKDHIVEVKEEIIEIDKDTFEILRCCIIIERAKNSLFDVYEQQKSLS